MHIVLVVSLIIAVIFIRFSTNFNSIKKIETRKSETIVCGLIVFLYASLRGESVGIDLETYSKNFIELKYYSILEIINISSSYTLSRDTFFWVFMKVLSFLSDSPRIMIVVIAAIVTYSISKFIYHSKSDVLFCFILFVCLRYFSFTLTGLRAALALSFIFLSLEQISKKNFLNFAILILYACLSHASSIIFALAYPIFYVKRTNIFIVFFSLIIIILVFTNINVFTSILSFIPFIDNRFYDYLQNTDGASGNVIFLIYLSIMISISINRHRLRNFILKKLSDKPQINPSDISNENRKFILYYNFFVIGTLISFVGIFIPNVFRVAYFFIIPSLFYLLPKLISYHQEKNKLKSLKWIVITLLLIQFIIIGPGAGTEKYVFFWQ